MLALEAVLARAGSDEASRLLAVNRFFNERIVFREDLVVWGRLDYWASPLELLARGEGDCEDYAIAKYFSLRAAGVPASRLRLAYTQARIGRAVLAHMVLAYYADARVVDPLVLDNLNPELLTAAQRPDLAARFSFNSEGVWEGLGARSLGDPLRRLPDWRQLLLKAEAEGFR